MAVATTPNTIVRTRSSVMVVRRSLFVGVRAQESVVVFSGVVKLDTASCEFDVMICFLEGKQDKYSYL